MRRPRLRVADLFCGAGGSTTGLLRALARHGFSPEDVELVAVNHWLPAIKTHAANHPRAQHRRSNVYRLAPRDAVPGGELDLLMASPTCQTHSKARGGKPISWDQRYGRMTPTQVVRWCRELKVKALLIENVPEFVEWGPLYKAVKRCDERVCACCLWKPRREKRGTHFRAWLRKLERAGFRLEWRIVNAANHGDATTRKRFFLMGRSDWHPIVWPAETHSKDGVADIFGAGAQRWRPAREIIEWSRRGRSIFRRKHRLARKTLERILAGALRFEWPEIFPHALRLHIAGKSVEHLLCSCGGDRPEGAEPAPLVMRSGMHKSNALCVRSAEEPLATATTDGGLALVVSKHGGPWNKAQSVDAPMPSATTSGAGYVVEPFLLPQGSNAPARSPDRPAPVVVAVARVGLVEPFVLNRHGENGGTRAHSVDAPVPTADCRGAGYLVEPFVLSQGAGGAARSVADPAPTIPTKGAHALIAPYHGASALRSVEQPLGTATTRDRFGLVVPVTHADSSHRERSVEQPLPTVTAAPRSELAFITAAFGERPGQAPRVHSIEDPMPSLPAKGRIPLAHTCTCGGIDILFRMLDPDELAAAMSFHDGEERYRFPGNKTEVTRLIGNAVAVRTAGALAWALVSSLVGRRRARRARAVVA